MDDITAQKIKRIYGLLWNAKTDRTTFSGIAVSEARKIALSLIDKAGQAEGIEWANREIPEKFEMVHPDRR
jgi:hypothetical protein